MLNPSVLHYVVTVAAEQRSREFATFDEACDALVLDVPYGVSFEIGRVLAIRTDLLVRATKMTARPVVA
jgi:hypothetical protein